MSKKPAEIRNEVVSPPVTLVPLDPVKAEETFQEFKKGLVGKKNANLSGALQTEASFVDFLTASFDLSPYLRDCAKSSPGVIGALIQHGFDAVGEALMTRINELPCSEISEADLMTVLRVGKRECALLCGLADLGGYWKTMDVTRFLARFADATLNATIRYLLREAHEAGKLKLPDPENPTHECGYVAIAMGKHGAFELNYSSDIDLIIFFDPYNPAVIDLEGSVDLFSRITKKLVKIMQERTADGYVFRTDLRLRPDPGSTPIAMPVDAAMHYYEGRGQNWERAAMIKARPAAGDLKLGESIIAELRPFVWRKYLDYAAISDIHSIKRQIHAHKGHGEIAVEGHNLKLGRGGIREIEFFVQTQQLIAGGRLPELRTRSTLEGLDLLAEKDWIQPSSAQEMASSYLFLRDVEHRLQMISDEQTHSLPEDQADIMRIALMMGFETTNAFIEVLKKELLSVEANYARLFEDEPELSSVTGNLVFTGEDDDPDTIETLTALGYNRPSDIIATVRKWHYGRIRATQSPEARERLTEVTPALLDALAKAGSADESLFAFDTFISGLPAGVQFFSLLKSNTKILDLLAKIIGTSPRMADIITRRQHVFDGLLEPAFFATVPDKHLLSERLDAALALATHYEDLLDRARIFAVEQRFLFGARLLTGSMDAQATANAFSDLAEVLVEKILFKVREAFEDKHGKIKGAEIVVLGMGKFASRELSAGSDLDLLLLYNHHPDAESSDGEKPLATSQYFARLTQRLIAAMSAPTGEGILYELDFRLRPSGNAGPLATHVDAFAKYQMNEAWTWEHMALTRARVICGDGALKDRVEEVIEEVLNAPRDLKKTRKDLLEMRDTLDTEKATENPWDVKTVKGGLIDIEFISQWCVLAGYVPLGSEKPTTTAQTLSAVNDWEALLRCNEQLQKSLYAYNIVTQFTRLLIGEGFEVETAPAAFLEQLCAALELPDIVTVEVDLKAMQQQVRENFASLLR